MTIILIFLGFNLGKVKARSSSSSNILSGLFIYISYLASLILYRDSYAGINQFFYIGLWPIHLIFLTFTLSLIFNENFLKILTDQLGSSFRNVLQYFEILMLIAVLISLARFRESGNLNFLQSLSISPFKILLLSSLGPILLSLLFMYAGQKSNLLNEKSQKFNEHMQKFY